jgi:hypothetical protein
MKLVKDCFHNSCVPGVVFPSQLRAWRRVSITAACLAPCFHNSCVPGVVFPSQLHAWCRVSITAACLASCFHHSCVPGVVFPLQLYVGSVSCSAISGVEWKNINPTFQITHHTHRVLSKTAKWFQRCKMTTGSLTDVISLLRVHLCIECRMCVHSHHQDGRHHVLAP